MITIRKYSAADQVNWDAFIREQSRNGTIFHEQKFLAYHPEGKFQDSSYLFEEEGKIIGVLPAALVNENQLVSHPGSSCGGLLFHTQCGLREVLSMVELLLRTCQSQRIETIQLRLAEPIFAWPVSDELSYALWHRGFELHAREISTCIPFDADYNWLNWGRKKNIFDIRKAEKEGFTVSIDPDTDTAWEIVNRNLDTRYQKSPTHTKAELTKLKDLYPDRIHPWVCRNAASEEVACVICFEGNKHTIHDFYISQDYTKVKLNLLPFVFQQLLEYYKESGYDWFNFGISSRADWIKWGILEFKERIGGRAVNRDTWQHNSVQQYTHLTEDVLL